MVAGGLPEMSYTTRLIPRTSLMMRLDTVASSSCGNGAQCAVMKSVVCTARNATTCSSARVLPCAADHAPPLASLTSRRRRHAAVLVVWVGVGRLPGPARGYAHGGLAPPRPPLLPHPQPPRPGKKRTATTNVKPPDTT